MKYVFLFLLAIITFTISPPVTEAVRRSIPVIKNSRRLVPNYYKTPTTEVINIHKANLLRYWNLRKGIFPNTIEPKVSPRAKAPRRISGGEQTKRGSLSSDADILNRYWNTRKGLRGYRIRVNNRFNRNQYDLKDLRN